MYWRELPFFIFSESVHITRKEIAKGVTDRQTDIDTLVRRPSVRPPTPTLPLPLSVFFRHSNAIDRAGDIIRFNGGRERERTTPQREQPLKRKKTRGVSII